MSYILVPPGDDSIDPLAYRASIPARLPPAINIDEFTDADPLPPLPSRPSTFDSTGDVRRKWIGAGKDEFDHLTNTGTITRLSPEQGDALRRKARSTGQKYIELRAKAVFTIKPSKFKIRIVACGNKPRRRSVALPQLTSTQARCGT